jgi:hypothetical protein
MWEIVKSYPSPPPTAHPIQIIILSVFLALVLIILIRDIAAGLDEFFHIEKRTISNPLRPNADTGDIAKKGETLCHDQ